MAYIAHVPLVLEIRQLLGEAPSVVHGSQCEPLVTQHLHRRRHEALFWSGRVDWLLWEELFQLIHNNSSVLDGFPVLQALKQWPLPA